VAALSRRSAAPNPRRRFSCDLLVGDGPGTRDAEQLISRYERYIACARQPSLRDVQRQIMKQRTDAVVEVVERSGRCVKTELMTALVAPSTASGGLVGRRRRGSPRDGASHPGRCHRRACALRLTGGAAGTQIRRRSV